MNQSNVVVYNDGEIELKVSVNEETIWLNAEDIAYIFNVKRPAIVKHIGNIYKDGELIENVTCSILEQVAKDGKVRKINFYNLDMIISLGYRVNSKKATKFRQWATSVLKNFHYRFLIWDETVYHFSASLKDLGKKVFTVNQMNITVNQLLKNI